MEFTDQLGSTITLPRYPQRIISLVPSQTELLFELGLDEEVVGVTRFCEHPREKCEQKTIVGGTKQFNFDVIDALKPDLILGNKEENYEAGIERLRQRYAVWMSDVVTLNHAYGMIQEVGAMVRRREQAAQLVQTIETGISSLPTWPCLRVAYFIWRRPYMVAGHGTFVQEMLHQCGFVNVFGHLPRYPEVSPSQILAARPDVLLLSSEPFPFSEKHVAALREHFPETLAVLVDGQMFSWYGSRLQHAPAYFRGLRRRLRAIERSRQQPFEDLRRLGADPPSF